MPQLISKPASPQCGNHIDLQSPMSSEHSSYYVGVINCFSGYVDRVTYVNFFSFNSGFYDKFHKLRRTMGRKPFNPILLSFHLLLLIYKFHTIFFV